MLNPTAPPPPQKSLIHQLSEVVVQQACLLSQEQEIIAEYTASHKDLHESYESIRKVHENPNRLSDVLCNKLLASLFENLDDERISMIACRQAIRAVRANLKEVREKIAILKKELKKEMEE